MSEIELEDWQQYILDEVIRENISNSGPILRLKLVEFVSYSAGRGKKRRCREVSLLKVDGKYAFVVKDGEIKYRKRRDARSQPDELAKEILTDLPEDERTPEALLLKAQILLGLIQRLRA